MEREEFENFSKILELYKLKEIPRDSSNQYYDEKDQIKYERRETTAEHVYSTLRLADFFLTTEKEFSDLDRLRVYELLMYHDDLEIRTGDIGISKRDRRLNKEEDEEEVLPTLSKDYPDLLDEKLIILNSEFRECQSEESNFASATDKMDSLVHELNYPQDWGPQKDFDEENVRKWFQPAFEYSPTFMEYFEEMINFLKENDYFED